jgi:putative transcriptional regulator
MATRFRLRELLIERGLTQTEIHVKTGLAYSTVNELCNNRARRIDLGTIDALCSALACQVGDLIEYSPEKKRRART